MKRLRWLSLQENYPGGTLKQLWGHKHESTHDTLIKYRGHEGLESLMLLWSSPPRMGRLTTGCLSDIKRLKSAERTLCLLFLVLHCVFVFPHCSLSSLIPFFLSTITARKGLLWAPGAWEHCAFHNKAETSHICKMGPCQLDRFFKQVFQQGEWTLLLWISEASSVGWRWNELSNRI